MKSEGVRGLDVSARFEPLTPGKETDDVVERRQSAGLHVLYKPPKTSCPAPA